MKTVTINLDGKLEQQVEALSRQEGRDAASIILDVLERSFGEADGHTRAAPGLEEIFASPVPSPFDAMSEEDVMAVVEEEIAAVRAAQRSA